MKSGMSAIPSPPVLPPSTKQNSRVNTVFRIEENQESSRIKGIEEQCRRIIVGSGVASHWMLVNVDVRPKLQGNAPRCGLVALSMAAEMARLSKEPDSNDHLVDEEDTPKYDDDDDDECELTALLNQAKELSFTSEGEMFSANNLAILAQKCYGLNTSVTDTSFDNTGRIVDHLLQGNPLLIPYDAAQNHEPCLSKGHKSHWALLTGFLCAVDESMFEWPELKGSCINMKNNQNITTVHILERPISVKQKLPDKIIPGTLYFLARQPKSRHVAFWSLKSLKESNSNLFELNTNKENAKNFVVPDGGVYEGLCKKIIYLNC